MLPRHCQILKPSEVGSLLLLRRGLLAPGTCSRRWILSVRCLERPCAALSCPPIPLYRLQDQGGPQAFVQLPSAHYPPPKKSQCLPFMAHLRCLP